VAGSLIKGLHWPRQHWAPPCDPAWLRGRTGVGPTPVGGWNRCFCSAIEALEERRGPLAPRGGATSAHSARPGSRYGTAQSLRWPDVPTGGWAGRGTPPASRGTCLVPCGGARRRPSRRPTQPSILILRVGRPERVYAAGKAPRFAERPSVAEPAPPPLLIYRSFLGSATGFQGSLPSVGRLGRRPPPAAGASKRPCYPQ
jgi:hypothetical protein